MSHSLHSPETNSSERPDRRSALRVDDPLFFHVNARNLLARHTKLLLEAALPFLCVIAVAGVATHVAPSQAQELPHKLWMAAVSYLTTFSIIVISWRTLTAQPWPAPREILETSVRFSAKTLGLPVAVALLLSPLLIIILPFVLVSQLFRTINARAEGHSGTLLLFGGWIFFGFLMLGLFRDLHPIATTTTWGLQLTFIVSGAMLVHHDLSLAAQELDEPSAEPALV